MDEENIRLSVPIDRKTNAKFSSLLPWGIKAAVIRALIKLFLDAQKEYGEDRFIADDLLKGRCKLVVQSLNIPGDKK